MPAKTYPASEYDAPEILPLIQTYFPYTEMTFDTLLERMHHPHFIFHKSMEKEQFTGYAEWQIVDQKKKILRLNGMAVKPAHQKKGHATELLRAGEKWARKKKMNGQTLLVAASNATAKKLYQKNGFVFARMHLKKIDGEKTEVWEKKLFN